MRSRNGIQILDDGETLKDLPGGLKEEDYPNFYTPFGFKVVEHKGKYFWSPGTKEDLVRAESKLLGISAENVNPEAACYMVSPGKCGGMCPFTDRFCVRVWDPINKFYWCTCV